MNVSYSVRHSEGQFKPWKYINNIFKPEVKGTQSNSESTNQSLAEKNTSGIFTPAQGETEMTEKREENFKTFDQGDGKFRVAGSMGPIHYKIDPFNEAEQYKEINLNIKPHTKTDSDTWYNR